MGVYVQTKQVILPLKFECKCFELYTQCHYFCSGYW